MNDMKELFLYIPPMWDKAFQPLLNSKNIARLTLDTQWKIRRKPLRVEETGVDNKAYQSIKNECRDNCIPVLVLPIAHCVENMDKHRLAVVGPAIKTRNDIFVFRSINIPQERCYLSPNKREFTIGVRERELTTSNISRIVFSRWSPDIFFFSTLENSALAAIDASHKRLVKTHRKVKDLFIKSYVRHIAEPDPDKRLQMVISGNIDAALFMGNEIQRVRPFQRSELIDAANLNRLINNIYNVKMFPRAVFAIFQSDQYSKNSMGVISRFVELFNNQVIMLEQKLKREQKEEARVQSVCLTGPLSDPQDVNTLIKFTKDMWDASFAHDRDGSRMPNKRSLKSTDFIWWDNISNAVEGKMSKFLLLLESTPAIDLFKEDRLSARLSHLQQMALNIWSQAKRELESDRNIFTLQKLKDIVDSQDITQDEKTTLKNEMDKLWKGKYGESL